MTLTTAVVVATVVFAAGEELSTVSSSRSRRHLVLALPPVMVAGRDRDVAADRPAVLDGRGQYHPVGHADLTGHDRELGLPALMQPVSAHQVPASACKILKLHNVAALRQRDGDDQYLRPP